ncbi:MAG: hypothetical protein K8U03_18785 [Planctomycetia bacterium]|nr:hypothetical protein [Planctomycetia bacterium]
MRSRWFVTCVVVLLVLSLATGLGLYGVYHAAQEVPDFYAEAVAMPETHADKASDEFTAGAFALANDVEKEGSWSSVFTDEQINGWLAVDLVEKHPNLLPPNFERPRIKILDDHVQVGVRCEIGGVKTIAWMDVEGQMTKNQELAVRFRQIRAGAVPLPLSTILDAVRQAAEAFELSLRWTTVNGDPTAIVGLPSTMKKGIRYELDRFTLTDGKLYVAGRTFRADGKPIAKR